MNTQITSSSYKDIIANARLLARETLRTRNIHKWVRVNAELAQHQNDNLKYIEAAKEDLDKANLNLARKEYQLSLLDTANPDYEALKKDLTTQITQATEAVSSYEVALENRTKTVTDANLALDKEIAENNEKIGRWESGENKVQLENLNDLAREYIEIAQNEKAKSL